MTFMEIESLDAKAQIKNDYEHGYDDGIKGNAKKKNSTMLYNAGYEFGDKNKGK